MESALPISNLDILTGILPAGLTCIATFWLFYKYLKATTANIGFSMILILCISDLVQSLILLTHIFTAKSLLITCLFFFSMYFSIFWAAAMSVLVFISIKSEDFNSKKGFFRSLLVVLIISTLLTFTWTPQFDFPLSTNVSIILPFGFCIFLTCLFFWLSHRSLQNHDMCFLKSAKTYINSLGCFSFAQMIAYSPSLVFLAIEPLLSLSKNQTEYVQSLTGSIASLAGFINAMIFFFQSHTSETNKKTTVASLTDLTQDFI